MWSIWGEPDAVLPPQHAAVFASALHYLSDLVGWEDVDDQSLETGIALFDRLTHGQKQVALLAAARALLRQNATPAQVPAYLAAAVAAVYETLLGLIELDLDTEPGRLELRGRVLAALDELGYWP